jgi:hypothetical protein
MPRTRTRLEFQSAIPTWRTFRDDSDEALENDPPTSPTTNHTKWVTRTSLRANCAYTIPRHADGNADGRFYRRGGVSGTKLKMTLGLPVYVRPQQQTP